MHLMGISDLSSNFVSDFGPNISDQIFCIIQRHYLGCAELRLPPKMEEEVALGETEREELATGAWDAHDDDAHDEDVVGDEDGKEDDDDYRISHLLS